ncbi:MAG: TIGR00730 family Rossman fold protein [Bacteriovoracaceae bacterium]|jgi:uncharacterized protein (TIGR00730 family)|nr:TIGR00730 family Rossman fold protein [Bacteriovoracaceae bacterium]
MRYKNIGIMCGSSNACSNEYLDMAYELGQLLGKKKHRIIYGGGAKGLMAKAADGALSMDAEVYGFMPDFMVEVEWQHKGLTKLITTKDMNERMEHMMTNSDATIFLPGGSGTMEEFFVWLCSKRLGHYRGPLIVVNYNGYYNSLKVLLDKMIQEKFHNPIHEKMYYFAQSIDEIPSILENSSDWIDNAIEHAAVKE